jgi:hypothetical protein
MVRLSHKNKNKNKKILEPWSSICPPQAFSGIGLKNDVKKTYRVWFAE